MERFSQAFARLFSEFAPIERLVGAVTFDHPQIGAFDFFVSGEAKGTLKTNSAPADAGTIARLARVDDFVVTKPALGTTHSVGRE